MDTQKIIGFIDRLGKIHQYDGDDDIVSHHYEIAHSLYPDKEYPEDYVRKTLGWITLGSCVYTQPTIYKSAGKPSIRQLQTLGDLGLKEKLLVLER